MFMNAVLKNKVPYLVNSIIVILLFCICLMGNKDNSQIGFSHSMFMVITSFALTGILMSSFPTFASCLLLLLSIGLAAYETAYGELQLIGIIAPGNYSLACTGSFANAGPYGGFLAVIISILAANSFFGSNKITRNITTIAIFVPLVMLPATQSRSALLALSCSMFFLAVRKESIRNRLITILKKCGVLIVPGVCILVVGAYLFKKPSADGRLFMNKMSIITMRTNGWDGVGSGHFGGAFGESQARYFSSQIAQLGGNDIDWGAIKEKERLMANAADNAFNEYLFIGVEYGPIAMILFVGIIAFAIIISIKRNTVWGYGLITFAVFEFFSYPLHIKQFQILFSVLLAACLFDNNEQKIKGRGLFITMADILVLFIAATLMIPSWRKYKQAEFTWEKTERWHQMECYDFVVEDCEKLYTYMKDDYRFLFTYGQALNKTGYYEKSDSILKMGSEISSDPMFWNVMGNNSLALGRYREAEDRYKHAFYMIPNRLYPLYLLAKLYYTENDTVRFVDISNRIEGFIPKVESQNTERLRSEIRDLKSTLFQITVNE